MSFSWKSVVGRFFDVYEKIHPLLTDGRSHNSDSLSVSPRSSGRKRRLLPSIMI